MKEQKPLVVSSLRSSLLFSIDGKDAPTLSTTKVQNYKGITFSSASSNDQNTHPLISQFGRMDYLLPSLLIEAEDGSYSGRFVFQHYEETDSFSSPSPLPASRRKGKGISFYYVDDHIHATLVLNISSFLGIEGYSFSVSVKNCGKKPFCIRKLSSLQLDLYGDSPEVYSLDGAWARERTLHKTVLNGGRMEIDSRCGASSSFHNPLSVTKVGDLFYGINLIYSGNHKTSIEVDSFSRVRIESGLNDFEFGYTLNPQDTFYSPEALLEVSDTMEGISSSFEKLVNNAILPPRFKDAIPPILFNSWEGVYFSFDKEKILSMAKEAKDLGAELFVLDDGWFGHREDDSSSLGDWYDNEKKTGGIASLANSIRDMGMGFGIWMEPESISEDSDLYRKHPEYAMTIPKLEPDRQRNQLLLDLTKKEVLDYVIESVSGILDLTKATYLKWDYNRNFSDIYSSSFPLGEYGYRYMVNLYKAMDVLTKKYPDVLFEGCAGGGSRFDLGILSYFPQIWASDNTDPLSRLSIQKGTLLGYPPSTITCHVSSSPNGNTHRTSLLSDRFAVALLGNAGYELDPTKLSLSDRKEIKEQICFLKRERQFLHSSSLYRLNSFEDKETDIYEFLSPDNKRILLLFATTKEGKIPVSPLFLDPSGTYLVAGNKEMSGKDLMGKGILFDGKIPKDGNSCHLKTRLVFLQKK